MLSRVGILFKNIFEKIYKKLFLIFKEIFFKEVCHPWAKIFFSF
jgi:hypothetical protein